MATRPVPSRHGRQRRPRWRCRRCGATSPWTWLGCGNGNGSPPGYDDQIKPLVESAAPDIAAWMQPETKDIDLAPVERMWNGLGLDPLPENFDWPLVGASRLRGSNHNDVLDFPEEAKFVALQGEALARAISDWVRKTKRQLNETKGRSVGP